MRKQKITLTRQTTQKILELKSYSKINITTTIFIEIYVKKKKKRRNPNK